MARNGTDGGFLSKRDRRRKRTRRHLAEKLEQRTLLAAQSLVAYFDFNDASTANDPNPTSPSLVGSATAALGSATFTDPGLGYQLKPGDRALRTAPGHAMVADTTFLESAAADNTLTISMWQQAVGNTSIPSAYGFYAEAPGYHTERGISAFHVESTNAIYLDHSGCCDATQRLSGNHDAYQRDWTHFAYVFDGSTRSIWVNGELLDQAGGAASLPTTFDDLVLGGRVGTTPFKGYIDEFAVFDAALTEDQIKILAQGARADSPALNDAVAVVDAGSDVDVISHQNFSLGVGTPQETLTRNIRVANNSASSLLFSGVVASGGFAVAPTVAVDTVIAPSESFDIAITSDPGVGTHEGLFELFFDGKPTADFELSLFSTILPEGVSEQVLDDGGDRFEINSGTWPTTGHYAREGYRHYSSTSWNDGFAQYVFDAEPGRTYGLDSSFFGLPWSNVVPTPNVPVRVRDNATGELIIETTLDQSSMPEHEIGEEFGWRTITEFEAMSHSVRVELHNSMPQLGGVYADSMRLRPLSKLNASLQSSGAVVDSTHPLLLGVGHVSNPPSRVVTLSNTSSEPMEVTSISLPSGLSNMTFLPLTVAAGQSVDLSLVADPMVGEVTGDVGVFVSGNSLPEVTFSAYGTVLADGDYSQVIDDGGDRYTEVYGNWYHHITGTQGNEGDRRYTASSGVVTWNFDTNPGRYDLASSFYGTSGYDTDAPVRVYDVATNTLLLDSTLDQESTPPPENGEPFGYRGIGSFNAIGGMVRVELESLGGPYVIADSMKITRQNDPFGLVTLFDFNDSSVGTGARSIVGSGFGDFVGATYTADGAGRSSAVGDRALDARNGYMSVADATYLNALAENDRFSISFWQKSETVQDASSVHISSDQFGAGAVAKVPEVSEIAFETRGSDRLAAAHTVDLTTWNHFVFVKDGPSKSIWVNGVLLVEGVGASPLPKDLQQLLVGGSSLSTVNGYIDDVALFDSALPAGTIATLAAGTRVFDLSELTALDVVSGQTVDANHPLLVGVLEQGVSSSRLMRIQNPSPTPLLVSGVDATNGFSISGLTVGTLLAPGEAVDVLISVPDVAGVYDGELRLSVDGSTLPLVRLPLSATVVDTPAMEQVVDDSDVRFRVAGGTWYKQADGYHLSSSTYYAGTVEWAFDTVPGYYDLSSAFGTTYLGASADVGIRVLDRATRDVLYDSDSPFVRSLDQTDSPGTRRGDDGEYRFIGSFRAESNGVIVEMRNTGSDGFVVADSMRIIRTAPMRALSVETRESIGSKGRLLFGMTTLGTESKHTIRLRNYSFDDLSIRSITTSGGFSVDASFNPNQIVPGGEAIDLPIVVNEIAGIHEGLLTVIADQNGPSKFELRLSATKRAGGDFEQIVDDGDSRFSVIDGNWVARTRASVFQGDEYLSSGSYDAGKVVYRFDTEPGSYSLWNTFETLAGYADNVVVRIIDEATGSLITQTTVDQSLSDGSHASDVEGWRQVAIFQPIGQMTRVEMTNIGANGYLVADAMRLVREVMPADPEYDFGLALRNVTDTADLTSLESGDEFLVKLTASSDPIPFEGRRILYSAELGFAYDPSLVELVEEPSGTHDYNLLVFDHNAQFGFARSIQTVFNKWQQPSPRPSEDHFLTLRFRAIAAGDVRFAITPPVHNGTIEPALAFGDEETPIPADDLGYGDASITIGGSSSAPVGSASEEQSGGEDSPVGTEGSSSSIGLQPGQQTVERPTISERSLHSFGLIGDRFRSWINNENRYDTTEDGYVTPGDALRVINELGRRETGPLETFATSINPEVIGYRIDVTQDGELSPRDALLVINELERALGSTQESLPIRTLNLATGVGSTAANDTPVAFTRLLNDADVPLTVSDIGLSQPFTLKSELQVGDTIDPGDWVDIEFSVDGTTGIHTGTFEVFFDAAPDVAFIATLTATIDDGANVYVIDDLDERAVTTVGTWEVVSTGYQGSQLRSMNFGSVAAWLFDTEPGFFELSATFEADQSYDPNVAINVYDQGTDALLYSGFLDQSFTPTEADGWRVIGDFEVPDHLIRVELAGSSANTSFVADAMRLRPSMSQLGLEADFDGDGRADAAFYDSVNRVLNVAIARDEVTETSSWLSIANVTEPAWFAGDFNGDGRDDLAFKDQDDTWNFAFSESTRFVLHDTEQATLWHDLEVLVGDFDGDGSDELLGRRDWQDVWQRLSFGSNGVSFDSDAGRSFHDEANVFRGNIFVGDVNRDGRDDLVSAESLSASNSTTNNANHYWRVATSRDVSGETTLETLGAAANFGDWFDGFYSPESGIDTDGPYRRLVSEFHSVYNNIELQHYTGLLKGPAATEETGRGNSFDQAALLVEKLRSINFEADIATGDITVEKSELKDWFGTKNEDAAVQLAARIHTRHTAQNSDIVSLQGADVTFGHVWVRTQVPTNNGLEAIDIDPSWKFKNIQDGVDIVLDSSHGEFDEFKYLAEAAGRRPDEFFEDELAAYLREQAIYRSIADIPYDGPIVQLAESGEPLSSEPWTPQQSSEIIILGGFDDIMATEADRNLYSHRIEVGEVNASGNDWKYLGVVPENPFARLMIEITASSGGEFRFSVDGTNVETRPADFSQIQIVHLAPGGITTAPSLYTLDIDDAGSKFAVSFDADQFSIESLVRGRAELNAAVEDGVTIDDIEPLLHYVGGNYWRKQKHDIRNVLQLMHTAMVLPSIQSGLVRADNALVVGDHSHLQFPIVPQNLSVDLKGGSFGQVELAHGEEERGEGFQLAGFIASALENWVIEEVANGETVSTVSGLLDAFQGDPAISSAPVSAVWVFETVRHPSTNRPTTYLRGKIGDRASETAHSIPYRSDRTNIPINTLSALDVYLAGHSASIRGNIWDALRIPATRRVTILVPQFLSYAGDDNSHWEGSTYTVDIEYLNGNATGQFAIAGSNNNVMNGGFFGGVVNAVNTAIDTASSVIQNFAGDPVNLANGNMFRDEIDLFMPNRGVPLDFGRHYDSQSEFDVGLGKGWVHSFSDRLLEDPNKPDERIWLDSEGVRYTFTRNGAAWTTPVELFGVFSETATGFVYKSDLGIEHHFTTTAAAAATSDLNYVARLDRILNRDGHGVELTYDTTATFLPSIANDVSDPLRRLDFGYGSTTTIQNIVKFDQAPVGTWHYEYINPDQLSKVTNPESDVVEFFYDSPSGGGRINRIIEADGSYHDYEYYANGRTFRVKEGVRLSGATPEFVEQSEHSFNYDLFKYTTEFIDENGNVETYIHQENGRLLRHIHDDRSRIVTTWGDGDEEYLMKSMTDEVGATEVFEYFTSGTFDRRLKTATDKLGVETDYRYSVPSDPAYSHIVNIRDTTRDPGGANQVTSFTYDALGRRTSTKDPLGQVQFTTYYETGPWTGFVNTQTSPKGHFNQLAESHDQFTNEALEWRVLTPDLFDVTGNELTVTLDRDQSDALADAVRIERIDDDGLGQLMRVVDNDTPLSPEESYLGRFQLETSALQGFSVPKEKLFHGDALRLSGQNRAIWNFRELIPGKYRIATTWAARAHFDAQAQYTIYDGPVDADRLEQVTIDQTTAPSDGDHYNAFESTFAYDDAGNVVGIQEAVSSISGTGLLFSTSEYDSSGAITKTIDPTGRVSMFRYDTLVPRERIGLA
ncbi:MAG: LamG-like jellyroll fold domain-containing protein [Planctomycetota bacterium]